MEKIEIFQGFWAVEDIVSNPDKIYIYGDNDRRFGKGGQAIIRDLPNTFGIRTKKYPSNDIDSFYLDTEFEENCQKIREDILEICQRFSDKTIVLSSGGYGTGLSKLPQTAPKTFQYLNELMKWNFKFDNTKGVKWQRIPSHWEIINSKKILVDLFPISYFDHHLRFSSGEIVGFVCNGLTKVCRVHIDSYSFVTVFRFHFEEICQIDESGNIQSNNFGF
jgi:hypothetical protein